MDHSNDEEMFARIASRTRRATRRKINAEDPHSIFEEKELLAFLEAHKYRPDQANKLWRYFISNPYIQSFEGVPNLPKSLQRLLKDRFKPLTTTIEEASTSADQATTKLLVRLQDGSLVETVIIRYDRKNSRSLKARTTVCISSKAGCKMGCTFCATGTMGFSGHLTTGEIVEQLVHANQYEKIRNVVFMGMGEPLDNYDNVVMACKAMIDRRRFGLAAHRISVSTVGVVPRMKQMLKDIPGIRLALSLHAPNQEIRLKIVPTATAYPIEQLIEAVDEHLATGARVMIEYIVIDQVNNSMEVAHELGKLLSGKSVLVNLIPYNPTEVNEDFRAPTLEAVLAFERILRDHYKLLTAVRRTMGQDIDGACGQLVVKKSCTTGGRAVNDIEDLVPSKRRSENTPSTSTRRRNQSTLDHREIPNVQSTLYSAKSMMLCVSAAIGVAAVAYVVIQRKTR
eukprot:TRINITY_DN1615_c2_g1_i2.p1 TRINITY_DN1615_c2_g1~~TRINITY_DN1615_c2_g1_i2.p1  ORF type:complete len:454 (-),score=87.63 TRINITY_DN1615_c2_g1_i2:2-1363(-)